MKIIHLNKKLITVWFHSQLHSFIVHNNIASRVYCSLLVPMQLHSYMRKYDTNQSSYAVTVLIFVCS